MKKTKSLFLHRMALTSAAALFPVCSHLHAASIQGQGTPLTAVPGGTVNNFDTGPTGIFNTPLTFSGVTLGGSGGDGSFAIDDQYIGDYNTHGVYSVNNHAGAGFTTFTFTFSQPVSAFAFLFGASDALWTLTAYDSGNSVLGTLAINPTNSSNAGDYFGIQSAGIVRATLTDAIGGDWVFIDDLVYLLGSPATPAVVIPPHEVRFELADLGAIHSAITSGLNTAVITSQAHRAASRTALRDINGHLFALRAGQGEEDLEAEESTGSHGATGDFKDSKTVQTPHASRPWKLFTTVDYGTADLESIGSQAGVQGDTWSPAVGAERRIGRNLTVGVAVSYLWSDQDYSAGLGGLKMDGVALSTYLSYAKGPFWSDLLYSYGNYNLETTRDPGAGFDSARGRTNTHSNALQFNAGWNFEIKNTAGKLVTGPFIGLDYLNGGISGYEERGGGDAALRYGDQNYDSLITRVGWQISQSFATPVGKITPQVRVSWERENLDNSGVSAQLLNSPYYLVRGTQVGNDLSTYRTTSVSREDKDFKASLDQQVPGRSYLVAGAGLQFDFGHGCSALVDYEGMLLRNNLAQHFVSLRLSYSF